MKKITQTDFPLKHYFFTLFSIFLVSSKINAQTFSCTSGITVSLGDDCRKEITPQLVLRGSNLDSFHNYQIRLAYGPYPYDNNFVTTRDIYRAVTAYVTHKTVSGSCLSAIYTRDTIPPTAESPPDIIIHCSQTESNGEPPVRVTGAPKMLFDCSNGFDYTYTDQTFYATCFTPFTQIPYGFPEDLNFNSANATGCSRVTVRTFRVQDTFDNAAYCKQVIYMKDALYTDIVHTPLVNKYCNGTPINTEPDTIVVNGVKIAGTGRPYYKTGTALTNGICHIKSSWQDTPSQSSDGYPSIRRLWTLTNPCQNRTDTAVQNIVIYDDAPSITCKSVTTFQIPNTKTLTVTAKELTATVSDQCTPTEKLIFGIRKGRDGTGFPSKDSLNLGCGDTLTYPIEAWVKDERGGTAKCNTTIRVIDTLYYCSPRPLSIEGKLNRENTAAIKAQVILSDLKSGIIMEQPLTTDFKFTIIQRDAIYKITPKRPKDWLNGISTFDIALISRHILGIDPLTSPYKIIASDVDGDGEISAADMLYIRRLVLRQIDSVPKSQPWRFVPSSFVFSSLDEALTVNFPQYLIYDHPTDNINNANFLAIKTGDVNLSARENTLVNAAVRDVLPSINFTVKTDKVGNIVFSSNETSIQGFQMTLNFDKTVPDIVSLENMGLKGFSENNYAIFREKGKITLSWNGKAHIGDLFKIKLKNPTLLPLQNVLQITSDLTSAEAYTAENEISTIKMALKPDNTVHEDSYGEGDKFELLPNIPNPFSDETTIRFNLPQADEVQFTLFDNRGRILKIIKKAFQKGYNEIKLPFYDIQLGGAEGVLGYKIQTAQETLMGRMVFMK